MTHGNTSKSVWFFFFFKICLHLLCKKCGFRLLAAKLQTPSSLRRNQHSWWFTVSPLRLDQNARKAAHRLHLLRGEKSEQTRWSSSTRQQLKDSLPERSHWLIVCCRDGWGSAGRCRRSMWSSRVGSGSSRPAGWRDMSEWPEYGCKDPSKAESAWPCVTFRVVNMIPCSPCWTCGSIRSSIRLTSEPRFRILTGKHAMVLVKG